MNQSIAILKNMFDYKIYNGKLNNSNVIEWLKNKCGVRIKESFIEEEFSNDLQDDLEMRFCNN